MPLVNISEELFIKHPQPFKNENLNKAMVGLSLEGMSLSKASMQDLFLVDNGVITMDEAIQRGLQRISEKNNT